LRKKVNEKFIFDFPRIEENKELFASSIDWEEEEEKLKNNNKDENEDKNFK